MNKMPDLGVYMGNEPKPSTIVVGIHYRHGASVPNMGLLPPAIYYDGVRIIIHFDPIWTNHSGVVSTNFDLLVSLGTGNIAELPSHDSLKVVHLNRLFKSDQMMLIRQGIRRVGDPRLTMPSFYETKGTTHGVSLTRYGIPEEPWVVIKREMGARGDEQALVPRHHLNDVLARSRKNVAELRRQFPEATFIDHNYDQQQQKSEVTIDSDEPFFSDQELVVTGWVEDIQKEFRILVVGDRMLGYERKITSSLYPQANLDVEGTFTGEIVPRPLSENFKEADEKALRSLISKLQIPLGSVDVYVDKDGRIGIFEYSPEYGFSGIDPTTIAEFHRDFIINALKDHDLLLQ